MFTWRSFLLFYFGMDRHVPRTMQERYIVTRHEGTYMVKNSAVYVGVLNEEKGTFHI